MNIQVKCWGLVRFGEK